jgi:hypothetical protein
MLLGVLRFLYGLISSRNCLRNRLWLRNRDELGNLDWNWLRLGKILHRDWLRNIDWGRLRICLESLLRLGGTGLGRRRGEVQIVIRVVGDTIIIVRIKKFIFL